MAAEREDGSEALLMRLKVEAVAGQVRAPLLLSPLSAGLPAPSAGHSLNPLRASVPVSSQLEDALAEVRSMLDPDAPGGLLFRSVAPGRPSGYNRHAKAKQVQKEAEEVDRLEAELEAREERAHGGAEGEGESTPRAGGGGSSSHTPGGGERGSLFGHHHGREAAELAAGSGARRGSSQGAHAQAPQQGGSPTRGAGNRGEHHV